MPRHLGPAMHWWKGAGTPLGMESLVGPGEGAHIQQPSRARLQGWVGPGPMSGRKGFPGRWEERLGSALILVLEARVAPGRRWAQERLHLSSALSLGLPASGTDAQWAQHTRDTGGSVPQGPPHSAQARRPREQRPISQPPHTQGLSGHCRTAGRGSRVELVYICTGGERQEGTLPTPAEVLSGGSCVPPDSWHGGEGGAPPAVHSCPCCRTAPLQLFPVLQLGCLIGDLSQPRERQPGGGGDAGGCWGCECGGWDAGRSEMGKHQSRQLRTRARRKASVEPRG